MTVKRVIAWILALLVGFGMGVAYTWVFSPVQGVDAEPRVLRSDFKDKFRAAIAAAYFANPDLDRAHARLALLGDADPSQAMSAQAQRMLAAGEPAEAVQKVAYLASALQAGEPIAAAPSTETITPTSIPAQTGLPVAAGTDMIESGQTAGTQPPPSGTPEGSSETEGTRTSAPALTATPRPTRTATPTLGAPYQLVGEDTICDPALEEGLLQVVVIDLSRRQIPGAEIIITWNSGEEHIFTGLKPELGHGYADFLMTPGVAYSVRMADGGTPASELTAPDCETTGREPYPGGIQVTFQQPR